MMLFNKANGYDCLGDSIRLKAPSYDDKQVVRNLFYDCSGRVNSVQNPFFATVSSALADVSGCSSYANYTYDAMSRVSNVTNPDGTIATVIFDRWLVSTFDENNHRKDYQLDAYDRIVRVQEFNIDPVLDDGIVHGFNTTYAYDVTGQLVQVNDTYGNQFGFVYDSLGRRTKLSDPDVGEWNYTYDLANNLISQAGGGGNLVTGDGFYREYNSLNQLTRIRNGSSATSPLLEQYYYDPFNERIKVWRNDSANTVVYTPFREFMQVRNSSGIYNYTYVYDGSTLVARVNPDQSVHYYHPDHLGSTTLITDQSGNVVEETFYEPFGGSPSRGSVTAVERWLDGGEHYREENMYGSSGELLSQIDALGRTTKYRYDSTKTFVEQFINPLGHVTRFSYDLGTGDLLWSKG